MLAQGDESLTATADPSGTYYEVSASFYESLECWPKRRADPGGEAPQEASVTPPPRPKSGPGPIAVKGYIKVVKKV